MVPLRPANVVGNPAPLPSYPVLHKPYGQIHDCIPEATSGDVGLTETHVSRAVGLPGMPGYVPGSALCSTVPHTFLVDIPLT